MKAVIQRVSQATVRVENEMVSQIGKGLLILIGIQDDDGYDDIQWLSRKIVMLRIFEDDNKVMNKSLLDCDGEVIVVSQFTLHASTKKGNRPSYIKAAKAEIAIPIYQDFIKQLETDLHKKVGTGIFGADMKISLINDGPVTIVIDTKNKI